MLQKLYGVSEGRTLALSLSPTWERRMRHWEELAVSEIIHPSRRTSKVRSSNVPRRTSGSQYMNIDVERDA